MSFFRINPCRIRTKKNHTATLVMTKALTALVNGITD